VQLAEIFSADSRRFSLPWSLLWPPSTLRWCAVALHETFPGFGTASTALSYLYHNLNSEQNGALIMTG
jgi:hypothetical protein